MSALDKAAETQISNIESKTGKTRAQLSKDILGLGLSKHGEMVSWVKETLDWVTATPIPLCTSRGDLLRMRLPLVIRWMRFTPAPKPISAPYMIA